MKILFNHCGVPKLFQIEKSDPKNYENMRRFIESNLPNVPPNYIIKYKDSDDDMLVLDSNKDIESLLETNKEGYVRATIQDENQAQANSDQDLSDEESDSEDSDKVVDSRLHSEVGDDIERSHERSFTKRPSILDNSVESQKPKQQQQPIINMRFGQTEARPFTQRIDNLEPVNIQQKAKQIKQPLFERPNTRKDDRPSRQNIGYKSVEDETPKQLKWPASLFEKHVVRNDNRPFTQTIDHVESFKIQKSKQQQRIPKTPYNQIETRVYTGMTHYPEKPRFQPINHYTKMTSEQLHLHDLGIKKTEEKIVQKPVRKEGKHFDRKQAIYREMTHPQPIQHLNSQQRVEKPPQNMSASLLRTKSSDSTNEKNVTRLVRTLFNQEFEHRLQAIIPRLMQKLKKEVRVSYPSLLSEAQINEADYPIYSEPQPHLQQQKIIHPTPCTGCTKEVIEGIRYKCLQCEQNFCQLCQTIIEHPHNLLKMRFVEIKQQKPQPIIDPKIQFVNKCFYLASYFDGQVKDYTEFVERHCQKKQKQLFEEYFSRNGKKLKKRMGQRLKDMCKKLGLYFGKDQEDYDDLVLKYPLESFESLVDYVKEHGLGSEQQQRFQSSLSQHTSSMRRSFFSIPNSSPITKITRSSEKPSVPNQQRQQFLFFILTRYQICPQKQPVKLEFAEEYYNKNHHLLSLQGIKTKFCEDVERKNKQQWNPVGDIRM